MKGYANKKRILITALTASCLIMALCGCAAKKEETNKLAIEPIVSEEDVQVNSEESSQTVPTTDTPTDTQTAPEKDTPTNSIKTSESSSDSRSLYEQFLNNNIPAAVGSSYPEGNYTAQILGKNSTLTLTELESRVSAYFFDPEYTDKTSCDRIQYAYVDCPDSADANAKNLLVKFVGLNIYAQDDDSYAVFILTENDGQLHITDTYQCWARSETTAYANGILSSFGSGGAGDHVGGLSVILSDGTQAPVYSAEMLSGWWISYVNDSIYNEVFGENTEPLLTVSIYTIGDKKYYQYDTSYCEESEIPLCENYINRCRDEAAINWISEEELKAAIQNRCTAVGIDYSIVEQKEEAVWNDLP